MTETCGDPSLDRRGKGERTNKAESNPCIQQLYTKYCNPGGLQASWLWQEIGIQLFPFGWWGWSSLHDRVTDSWLHQHPWEEHHCKCTKKQGFISGPKSSYKISKTHSFREEHSFSSIVFHCINVSWRDTDVVCNRENNTNLTLNHTCKMGCPYPMESSKKSGANPRKIERRRASIPRGDFNGRRSDTPAHTPHPRHSYALLDPKILDPKTTNRKQRKSSEIESNMYGKGVCF